MPRLPRLQVELTTLCNMACEFCSSPVSERPAGHMAEALSRAVVEEAASLTDTLIFSGLGEPLLNPRALDCVALAKSRGLWVSLISNGLILTPERCREVMAAGTDRLHVSLHNLSADSFLCRHPRPAVPYEAYFRNVLDCLEAHVRSRAAGQFTLTLMSARAHWFASRVWDFRGMIRDSENPRESLADLWKGLEGVAARSGEPLLLARETLEAQFADPRGRIDRPFLKLFPNAEVTVLTLSVLSARSMLAKRGPEYARIAMPEVEEGGCLPAGYPTVLADGQVVPCCAYPAFASELKALSLGRVGEGVSLASVFDGARFRAIDEGFRDGRAVLPYCKACRGIQEYTGWCVGEA